jgi:hypothetical protein
MQEKLVVKGEDATEKGGVRSTISLSILVEWNRLAIESRRLAVQIIV